MAAVANRVLDMLRRAQAQRAAEASSAASAVDVCEVVAEGGAAASTNKSNDAKASSKSESQPGPAAKRLRSEMQADQESDGDDEDDDDDDGCEDDDEDDAMTGTSSSGKQSKGKSSAKRGPKRVDGKEIPHGVATKFTQRNTRTWKSILPSIDLTSATAKVEIRTGHVRCSICAVGDPEHRIRAKTDAIQRHKGSEAHKAKALAKKGTDVDVYVQVPTEREELAHRVKTAFSGYLVAHGLPVSMMDTLVQEVADVAVTAGHPFRSTHTRQFAVPATVKEIADIIKAMLVDKPFMLLMDGGTAKFGDGMRGTCSVYNILVNTAYVRDPILIDTHLVRGESPTAEFLASLAIKSANKVGLDLKSPLAIGGLSDNASAQKKAIGLAGLTSGGCGGHTLDLAVDESVDSLGAGPILYTFNSYCAPATGMHLAMKAAGIAPNKLQTADYKFHHASGMFVYLVDNYAAIKAFVLANKPKVVIEVEAKEAREAAAKAAGKGKRTKAKLGEAPAEGTEETDKTDAERRTKKKDYDDLVSLLTDPITLPRLIAYNKLTGDLTALIRASEGTSRTLPRDWNARLTAHIDLLKDIHTNTEPYVDYFIKKSRETLTADQRALLQTNIEVAVEKMWDKFERHLGQLRDWAFKREAWHPWNTPPTGLAALLKAAGPLFVMEEEGFVAEANEYYTAYVRGDFNAYLTQYRDPRLIEFVTTVAEAEDSALGDAEAGQAVSVLEDEAPAASSSGGAAASASASSSVAPAKPSSSSGGAASASAASPSSTSASSAAGASSPLPLGDPVDFWNQESVASKYPKVRKCALYWLSVLLSTACVERTYSIMRHMEQSHKLSKKDATVLREMYLRCNAGLVGGIFRRYHAALVALGL